MKLLDYCDAKRTPGAWRCECYLDGKKMEGCFEANAREGWAKCWSPSLREVKHRGRVEIHAPDDIGRHPDDAPPRECPLTVTFRAAGQESVYEFVAFRERDAKQAATQLAERMFPGGETYAERNESEGREIAWLKSVNYGVRPEELAKS